MTMCLWARTDPAFPCEVVTTRGGQAERKGREEADEQPLLLQEERNALIQEGFQIATDGVNGGGRMSPGIL